MTVHSKSDITAKIIETAAQHLSRDADTFIPATRFEDLGADEFDMIELVMKWEDEFEVVIEDDELPQLVSVQAVAECIAQKKG